MVIVEVGGTVGDIESLPFLEAIRQMRKDVGRGNVLYVHVTWLPQIGATGELKTKPTQHSVSTLRGIGIQPDVIVLRSDEPIDDELLDKVALFTDVDVHAVIPLRTARSIYEVPLLLERAGLGKLITRELDIPASEPDLADWQELVARIRAPAAGPGDRHRRQVHRAARRLHQRHRGAEACGPAPPRRRQGALDPSEQLERMEPSRWPSELKGVAGVLVPGGFGYRGVEGKVRAIRWAREQNVPFLGLCLGLQCAVIEFGRVALDNADANSSEFNVFTEHPVIDLMPDQADVTDKGGTMRLGSVSGQAGGGLEGARGLRRAEIAYERHRHRFEVNNAYRDRLGEAGMGGAASRRMVGWSSTSSCATTPGSSRPRPTPS